MTAAIILELHDTKKDNFSHVEELERAKENAEELAERTARMRALFAEDTLLEQEKIAESANLQN